MNQVGALYLANERGRICGAGTDSERDMPMAAQQEPPAPKLPLAYAAQMDADTLATLAAICGLRVIEFEQKYRRTGAA